MSDTKTVTHRARLGDGVDGQAITRGLKAASHPGLAPIISARVEDAHVVVDERAVDGHPLADEPPPSLTDKVVALATELLPPLRALADQGVAHGRLEARHVVRREDGTIVLAGAIGLGSDGRRATSGDDVRALLSLIRGLLPEHAPEVTRKALDELIAADVSLDALHARLVALRAAIPIPKGRHIRSIQRLAFPPATTPPKRSKRYVVRVLLAAAVVGLGLYVAFDVAGSVQASDARPAAVAPKRASDGVVFLKLSPLPPTRHDAGP